MSRNNFGIIAAAFAILAAVELVAQDRPPAFHPEAVGYGAGGWAFCSRMVIEGPDGIRYNGDEWPFHVTQLNHEPSGPGSLKHWMEEVVSDQRVEVGMWTTGGEVNAGPDENIEPRAVCQMLTGKLAAGGGVNLEWDGRITRGRRHNERWVVSHLGIYLKRGGWIWSDLEDSLFEHNSCAYGGAIPGHTVCLGGAGDTVTHRLANGNLRKRNKIVRNITDHGNLRAWGLPRIDRWGPGYPRSEPPTTRITMCRNLEIGRAV